LVETPSGAALYTLHQTVQGDQVSGFAELPDTVDQFRDVIRRLGRRRNMNNFDYLGADSRRVSGALVPAKLDGIQPAVGDGLIHLFQGLIGEKADHSWGRTVAASHLIDYDFRVLPGNTPMPLRHEDHADEVRPGLRGGAGVVGVADPADLDSYRH
jgi:hypothetical protein